MNVNWDKFFIIILEKEGLLENLNSKFHDRLTKANGVKGWWHYIGSTYIIKVENTISAHNISEFIQKLAPKRKFLTMEVHFTDYNGWLPQDAWDWIKNNQ